MSTRTIVNVATGRYIAGQQRLLGWCMEHGEELRYWDHIPEDWPTHQDIPYAFKAFALRDAERHGATTLLWMDASVVPIADLTPLWDQIERDGYWIARNGWENEAWPGYMNREWTADSALPELFPGFSFVDAQLANREILHVMATAFGVNLLHPVGHAFFEEYFRLASETRAFCGPWNGEIGVKHRHDQTAASAIAWRLSMKLTVPPDVIAYKEWDGKPGYAGRNERTMLLVDGSVNA